MFSSDGEPVLSIGRFLPAVNPLQGKVDRLGLSLYLTLNPPGEIPVSLQTINNALRKVMSEVFKDDLCLAQSYQENTLGGP